MYARHRFPSEIISYAVWLYLTFPLSYRDVQKLLLYRGVEVSYEAIRAWCQKFGQQFASEIRRRRPRPSAKWHLDEMVITINGEHFYLWRTVDEDGNVLDILMQKHRDKAAALKFFRKLLKKQGFAPRVIVTDKLKSYGAAKREMLPNTEHRQHKGLNNRAENSHDSHPSPRATNATVQISRSRATLPFCFWLNSRTLSSQPTRTHCH